MTITEFLLARIAEDEAVANMAAAGLPEWEFTEGNTYTWGIRTAGRLGGPGYEEHHRITLDREGLSDSVDTDAGPHIARFDPARVLAECDAKRRIVEAYEYLDADPDLRTHAWSFAVRCLTLPYADHPDYQQEWKP